MHLAIEENIAKFAGIAGKELSRPVAVIYSALRNPKMTQPEKNTTMAALVYIILPITIVPHSVPSPGFLDETGMVRETCRKIAKYITPEVEREAEVFLAQWFPDEPEAAGT